MADGSVRDLDEARKLSFHFCAAHVSVSHPNVHTVDFGIPVKLGGVWINPGDLLHSDQHGVVMIPDEIAERIPEATERVAADEQCIIQACQAKGITIERFKAGYKSARPDAY